MPKQSIDKINTITIEQESALSMLAAMNDPSSPYRKKILNEQMQNEEFESYIEAICLQHSLEDYLIKKEREEAAMHEFLSEQAEKEKKQLHFKESGKISSPSLPTKKEEAKALEAQIKQHLKTIKHLNQAIQAAQNHLTQLSQQQAQNNQNFIQNINHISQLITHQFSGPNAPVWIGPNNQPINNQLIVNAHVNAWNNLPTPQQLSKVLGSSHPMNQVYQQQFDQGMTMRPTLTPDKKKEREVIGLALANQNAVVVDIRSFAEIYEQQEPKENSFAKDFLQHLRNNPAARNKMANLVKPVLQKMGKDFEREAKINFTQNFQHMVIIHCEKNLENENKALVINQNQLQQIEEQKKQYEQPEQKHGHEKTSDPKNKF